MRLSFLQRFAALTAILTVGAAIALAFLFVRIHARSIQSDIIATAVGQAEATLGPTILKSMSTHRGSSDLERRLDRSAAELTSFQEYLRGIRVYRADGTAIYPLDARPQPLAARRAIAAQNVVLSKVSLLSGERVRTAYAPLADPTTQRYVAVLGVKVSIDQIQSQDLGEIRIVVIATVASSALIFLSLLALALAAQRELDRRKRLADETFTQTMGGIASIVDKRDPYTAGHSMRVAQYSKSLARRMKLRASEIRRVEIGALLHDIGKVGVPDAVLLKKDRLDESERAIIALHPQIAGEIFNNVEAMTDILPCIVAHHERIDGRGYPGRLAGESIPLGARIIAVADAYDAMTTDRPYRRALSSEVACEELRRCVDSHFDRACVAAFLTLVEDGSVVPPPPILDDDIFERSFGQQLPGRNA